MRLSPGLPGGIGIKTPAPRDLGGILGKVAWLLLL
jgi:hypothetical protein